MNWILRITIWTGFGLASLNFYHTAMDGYPVWQKLFLFVIGFLYGLAVGDQLKRAEEPPK